MALETYTPFTAGAGTERPSGSSHSSSRSPKIGSNEEHRSNPSSVRSRSSSRGPKHKPTSLAPSTHSAQKPCPSPLYEEVAKSPPMTSFLNDRYAASTAQESVYLEHIRKLRIAKYVLSGLIIATATGALATSGHTLWEYNHTKLSRSWSLSLWPVDLDLKPTIGILIPAAIAIVSTAAWLGLAIVPSPHARTTLLNALFLAVTCINFILALFSVAFCTALVYNVNPSRTTAKHPFARQSIQSFTCSFYRSPGQFVDSAKSLQLPVFGKIGYPSGFGRVCRESEASLACMVAVLVLTLVGFALWGMSKVYGRSIDRGRRIRYDEKWSGSDEGARCGSGKVTPSP